jgi:hypothetical protein
MAFSMKGPGGPRSSRAESGHSDGGDDGQPGRNESDEAFRQVIEGLSSQLSARFSAAQPPGDLEPESDGRPDEAYSSPIRDRPGVRLRGARRSATFEASTPKTRPVDRTPLPRGRTLRLLLGFTLGATAAIAGVSAFHTVTTHQTGANPPAATTATKAAHDMAAVVPPPPSGPQPPSGSDIVNSASSKPAASEVAPIAVDKPAPEHDTPPTQPASSSPNTPSSPAQAATAAPTTETAPSPATAAQPGRPAATAGQATLAPYEVMEVQTRLQWLGFSPGGLDGISGRLTGAAVKRYEAAKGLPQTGTVDQSLLGQLRQDSLRPDKP